MQRKSLVIGALLALPIMLGGGALAFAASNGSSPASPANAFIADVASHLGVPTTTLERAVGQAEIDQVQLMVSSGKLTSAQATKIEAAISSGKLGAGLRVLAPGGQVLIGGRHVRRVARIMIGRTVVMSAAGYLGLTPQQLRSDLRGGETLSAVATATAGKTAQGLESAITSALQQRLQQAVTSGQLTQPRASNLESHLPTLVQRLVTHSGGMGMVWISRHASQSQPATSN